METLLQDLRYGLRTLRNSPGFALVAVIALALGIASTTAIFSVVDTVLLHPLPYPEASHIFNVSLAQRSTGVGGGAVSPADYLDWAAQNHVFAYMAASRGWQVNLSGGDRPERIRGTMTTGDFFPLFDVRPVLGRTLLPEDSTPGNDHVVVLGYGLWKRSFGSAPSILGRNIVLNGESYTVVGVMPPDFKPDSYGELWLPSRWGVPPNLLRPNEDPRPVRDSHYLQAWGRLKPGVSLQQARDEMDVIARQLEKQYPDSDGDGAIGLVGMQENMVSDIRPILLLLLVAVVFVLLIGCANPFGKARKWLIKSALCGIAYELLVNLSWDPFHDDLGMDHMLAHSLAQQGNLLVQARRKLTHPGQPVFIVFDSFKAKRAAQIINGLRALTLVKAHQKPVRFVLLHAIKVAFLEEVVIELVGFAQCVAVDPLKLGQHLLVFLVAPGIGLKALVRPAIIPAPVTQQGRFFRVLLHFLFPGCCK